MNKTKPAFHTMTLQALADWVSTNNGSNGCSFDSMPAIDGLTDAEISAARDEYESMADELFYSQTN